MTRATRQTTTMLGCVLLALGTLVVTVQAFTSPARAPSCRVQLERIQLCMTATTDSPGFRSLQEEEDGRQRRRLQRHRRGGSSTLYNDNNLMKDETGHVNRKLAENLWQWEQNSRQEKQLPKVEYSVRSGLRLVDQQVKELLSRQNNKGGWQNHINSPLHADLVQEGLTALLDAMSHYREGGEEKKDLQGHDFEAYAGRQIRQHLQQNKHVHVYLLGYY